MASTDKSATSVAKPEVPPAAAAAAQCTFNYPVFHVALRVLLVAATVTSVVVMVTSKQTELVPLPGYPTERPAIRAAKFNHSPAFIYFVAALSVTALYSIITALASLSIVYKPPYSKNFCLAFAFLDVVFVGIVASATGAAGGVGYIGLKGNSNVSWMKICSTYDKFCRQIGSSIAVALFAAILLVWLCMISTYALFKKIPH